MPIQTATLEQCVSGLKRTIDSQAATIERQARQLQDARAWAALWKRASRGYRANYLWGKKRLEKSQAEIQRQAAEVERLRGALELIIDANRVGAGRGVYLAIDRAASLMREADHDPR